MMTLSHVTCRQGAVLALDDVSGRFGPGITAVAGPNGAGKTTLLRALAGLQNLASGNIDRGGLGPRDIALLPQASQIDRRFPVTAADLVALGAWPRLGAWRAATGPERGRVAGALAAMGLAGLEGRLVGQLSAGQFQRVLFARLMLQDARAILLDEPTTSVDAATETVLCQAMRDWAAEGRIVVVASHDLGLVTRHCATTLLLSRAVVAWGPTDEVLTDTNLRAARALSDTRDLAA